MTVIDRFDCIELTWIMKFVFADPLRNLCRIYDEQAYWISSREEEDYTINRKKFF